MEELASVGTATGFFFCGDQVESQPLSSSSDAAVPPHNLCVHRETFPTRTQSDSHLAFPSFDKVEEPGPDAIRNVFKLNHGLVEAGSNQRRSIVSRRDKVLEGELGEEADDAEGERVEQR